MEIKNNIFMNIAEDHNILNKKMIVDGQRLLIPLDGRDIEVIYYKSTKKNAPIIFTAFGGGFIMGGCALDNIMWKTMSQKFDCNIISVGYRKAPKNKYPDAIYDFYDTVKYFVNHSEEYDYDKDNIIVFGSSAGGNIAAAATILDKKMNTNFIKKQILNYPYLDLSTKPADKNHDPEEIFIYELFPSLYCNKEELKESLLSPVYASKKDLKNMPPMSIILAEKDPLFTEGKIYADKLKDVGVSVDIYIAEEMGHGFLEVSFSLEDDQRNNEFIPESIRRLHEIGLLKKERENTMDFILKSIDMRSSIN